MKVELENILDIGTTQNVRDSEIGKSWFTSKSDLLKKIAEQL
jgi:hypothetical protein